MKTKKKIRDLLLALLIGVCTVVIAQEAPKLIHHEVTDTAHIDMGDEGVLTFIFTYEWYTNEAGQPAAGFGVVTTNYEGDIFCDLTQTNETIAEKGERAESWWWQLLPH